MLRTRSPSASTGLSAAPVSFPSSPSDGGVSPGASPGTVQYATQLPSGAVARTTSERAEPMARGNAPCAPPSGAVARSALGVGWPALEGPTAGRGGGGCWAEPHDESSAAPNSAMILARMHPIAPVRWSWHALFALTLCSTWGCADRSLISLSAAIETPSIQVTKGTLGSELAGGFDLRMSLGSRAGQSTDVSLGSFSIVRASDSSSVVDPLDVTAQAGVSFPLTVDPGKTLVVSFGIGGAALLTAAESDALCAEPVMILGAVTDTLSGDHATSLRSNAVSAVCL